MLKSGGIKTMKKKIIKSFEVIILSIFKISHLVLALPFIFLTGYFFGNRYLSSFSGGDIMFHISLTQWFSKWFPNIPLWFPIQGAGIPLVFGYPSFPHIAIAAINHIFGTDSIQTFLVAGLLSVPFTAFGIYLYGWFRLKSQTIGITGAFLYFLSPITWYYLFHWGFYGEAISYAFIPPVLIFYDLFLCSFLENRYGLKFRLSVVGTMVSLGLLIIVHPNSAMGTLSFLGFFTFFYPILLRKRIIKILSTWVVSLVVVLASIALIFFHEINVLHTYSITQSLGKVSELNLTLYGLKPKQVLSLYLAPPGDDRVKNEMSFALPVWIAAFIGSILSLTWAIVSFFKKKEILEHEPRKVVLMSVFSLVMFYLLFDPLIFYKILSLGSGGHQRPIFTTLRIFVPILGGYGVWIAVNSILSVLTFWKKHLGTVGKGLAFIANSLVVPVLTMLLAIALVYNFRSNLVSNYQIRYGPDNMDTRDFFLTEQTDLCDFYPYNLRPICKNSKVRAKFQADKLISYCTTKLSEDTKFPYFCGDKFPAENYLRLLSECGGRQSSEDKKICPFAAKPLSFQLNPLNWPKPKIIKGMDPKLNGLKYFTDKTGSDSKLRVDMSPGMGGLVQEAGIWNQDLSQVSLYAYQAHLSGPIWGYQQMIFYSNMGTSASRKNLAELYGIKYVFYDEGNPHYEVYKKDPAWKYKAKSILEFKNPTKLYSWFKGSYGSLVIGDKKLVAYEPFFKTANEGAFNYSDGILVRGKENIDDYSISDLKKYNKVMLFGYKYKNKNTAFNLLEKYVKEGGNLFISTGWQFIDRDWEAEKLPKIFPVDNLKWSSEKAYSVKDFKLSSGVFDDYDSSKFSPLIWDGKPWGISVPDGVRDWGEVVLKVGENPIVVRGTYGKGRVVWTGLNWPGHILTFKNNQEELKFLNRILNWLGGENKAAGDLADKIQYKRDYPDRVEVSFLRDLNSESSFYFRETFHPDWKARLDSANSKKRINISRGGPDLMLFALPPVSSGDKLILEYRTGIRGAVGVIVSLSTLLLILLYLFFEKKLLQWLNPMSGIFRGVSNKISKDALRWVNKSDEEESY